MGVAVITQTLLGIAAAAVFGWLVGNLHDWWWARRIGKQFERIRSEDKK